MANWDIRCEHCRDWFKSPIDLGTVEEFISSAVEDNIVTCIPIAAKTRVATKRTFAFVGTTRDLSEIRLRETEGGEEAVRIRDVVAGSMALVALGGLALVALGLVQWGYQSSRVVLADRTALAVPADHAVWR